MEQFPKHQFQEIQRNPKKSWKRRSKAFSSGSKIRPPKPSPAFQAFTSSPLPSRPPTKNIQKSTRSCHVSIGFHLGQVSDNGSLCASIGSHRCLGNAKAFDSFFDQANLLGAEMRGLELSAGKKSKVNC